MEKNEPQGQRSPELQNLSEEAAQAQPGCVGGCLVLLGALKPTETKVEAWFCLGRQNGCFRNSQPLAPAVRRGALPQNK